MNKAIPGARRGCGYRVSGGVYLETGLTKFGGQPVEHFLADPPHPYEPDAKIGVQLVEKDGVYHILDWVGEQHYPWPADFVEEVRRYGLSRRVAVGSVDWAKLSPASRILCIHRRGYITNTDELEDALSVTSDHHAGRLKNKCGLWVRSENDFHLRYPDQMCSRYHWVYPSYERENEQMEAFKNVDYRCVREFAGFKYRTYPLTAPEGLSGDEQDDYFDDLQGADFTPAIFASFPLSRACIIRSEDGSHEEKAAKIRDENIRLRLGFEDE